MRLPWIHTDCAYARNYEQRLARLLETRFGQGRGTPSERIAAAADYLPDTIRRRFEDLARELENIKRGKTTITNRDVWRTKVESILASAETNGPYIRTTPRRRRLGWFGHTVILVGITMVYLNVRESSDVAIHGWVDRVAIWIALGYIYWAWDRGLQMGWPPSRTRAVLRCLLFILVASSPIALALALLNLRDYARSSPVTLGSNFDSSPNGLNPTTGLPMTGGGSVDVAGNSYGSDGRPYTG